MKNTLSSLITLLFLAPFSISAFAHPGHDHSHWTSELAHSILFVAIACVVAMSVKFMKRKSTKSNSAKKES